MEFITSEDDGMSADLETAFSDKASDLKQAWIDYKD